MAFARDEAAAEQLEELNRINWSTQSAIITDTVRHGIIPKVIS